MYLIEPFCGLTVLRMRMKVETSSVFALTRKIRKGQQVTARDRTSAARQAHPVCSFVGQEKKTADLDFGRIRMYSISRQQIQGGIICRKPLRFA